MDITLEGIIVELAMVDRHMKVSPFLTTNSYPFIIVSLSSVFHSFFLV